MPSLYSPSPDNTLALISGPVTARVSDLSPDLVFIADSSEVLSITNYLGGKLVKHRYHSFFVRAVDGEFVEVWGMFGIIPFLDRVVYRIL